MRTTAWRVTAIVTIVTALSLASAQATARSADTYQTRAAQQQAAGSGAELAPTGSSAAAAEGLDPCAEATERCDGTVEVPLDWSAPSSERIDLAFAFIPRTDQSLPATGTVLAFVGAIPHIPLVSLLQQILGPVLEHKNLLLVDPRGMGQSSPLICPSPGLDPADPYTTIAACAEQLGPRIQFYAADQVAFDLDAVRTALGLPKLTLYVNSYGTLFGQAYVTRFPEHVAAVFMDSVFSTNADGYADRLGDFFTWNLGPALRQHDGICDASAACRRLPGSTEDRLGKVLQVLRAHPDPSISSRFRLVAMVNGTSFPEFGRELNAALDSYAHGDPAPLRRLSALQDRLFGPPARPPLGTAADIAEQCNDSVLPFDRTADAAERREQLDRYYAEKQPFAPFTQDEMHELVGAANSSELCVQWPTPRPSPVIPPGASYPNVPVLVVNGEHDVTTLPEGARLVANRFPEATFQEIPYGRHASSWGLSGPASQCVNATMRDFLTNPRYPMPASHCNAESYRAIGKFPTRVREVSPAAGPGLTGTQKRIVTAAFATAQDAAERRNPYAELYRSDRTHQEPGLRGGTLHLPADGTIQLDQVRYVQDLAVTGNIAIPSEGTADADLQLAGASQATLELTWQPYQPTNRFTVTGTLNGQPFHATVRNG